MACGGCRRRKQKMAEIWHKHLRPKHIPSGEMQGGIGQKVTSTGPIHGKVHVLTRPT